MLGQNPRPMDCVSSHEVENVPTGGGVCLTVSQVGGRCLGPEGRAVIGPSRVCDSGFCRAMLRAEPGQGVLCGRQAVHLTALGNRHLR